MTETNKPGTESRTVNPDSSLPIQTSTELSAADRSSLYQLINIANDQLIDRNGERQTAIDALSIASILVSEDNPESFGIAPGNVPENALPANYNTNAEKLDQ